MLQNLSIRIAPGTHYGSADLAQAHAMPPACAMQYEPRWDVSATVHTFLHGKCGTIEMGRRQCTAYLQLLSDDHSPFCAHYLQFPQTPRSAPRHRHEVNYLSEINATALLYYSGQLVL